LPELDQRAQGFNACVCGFVRHTDGQILLVRSPKRGWELPGGQIEAGESLIEALKREVVEESSVEISILGLIGIYSNLSSSTVTSDKLIHLFECSSDCETPTPDNEIIEAGWFDEDTALQKVTHQPNLLRLQDSLSGAQMYRVYRDTPFKLLDSFKL